MCGEVKKWFVIAGLFVAVGVGVFILALARSGWDITKLSTVKLETNNYEITDDFSSVSIDTRTADITVLLAEDGKCRVECNEKANMNHSVSVNNGTLSVKLVDTRKWYEYISMFSFDKTQIKVYLPKLEYDALTVKVSTGDAEIAKELGFKNITSLGSTGDIKVLASVSGTLKIERSTGDIRVENITAGALDIEVSTGDITLTNVNCTGNIDTEIDTGKIVFSEVSCKNLISDGDTGDIHLTNVTASEQIKIEVDSGDVRLARVKATGMEIETDTGDVKGTVLSEMHFIAKTKTGKVNVPETGGNICRITTDTGDIIISITE